MRNHLQILFIFILFTACTSAENYQENKQENIDAIESMYEEKVEPSLKKEEKKDVKEEIKKERGELKNLFLPLPLEGDSGFITQEQGGDFLQVISLPDTVNIEFLKLNDTIGKYYKISNSTNYLICFNRYCKSWLGHNVLVEVTSKGKYVNDQIFTHGNHQRCWGKEPLDGFRKYGHFFEFISCGTGSGHSSSHLYVFKKLKLQDSISSIVEHSWTAWEHGTYLQSTKKYKGNTLTMNYQLDSLYFDQENNDKEHSTKINEGTIVFEYKKGKWITKDSLLLKTLENGAY